MSTAAVRDKITDLEKTIENLENLVRVTRTDMANDQFFERSISSHRERIAWHQKMIDDMMNRRARGPQIIDESTSQIRILKAKIKLLACQRQIDKLIAVQQEMSDLSS